MTTKQAIAFASFCKQYNYNPPEIGLFIDRLNEASSRIVSYQLACDTKNQPLIESRRKRMQSSSLLAYKLAKPLGLDVQWQYDAAICHTGRYTIKCNGFTLPCKSFLKLAVV